jgi:glycosyltransferase involved in cell wall biosynthesis
MITINTAISTSAGGIESLIRNLHKVYNEKSTEYYSTSKPKEIFERHAGVKYCCVGEIKSGNLQKIMAKIRLYLSLLFTFPYKQKIVIFHPTDLIYIPLITLLMNQIVLVQTNRIDISFTKLGKLAYQLKGWLVNNHTVYTDFDKKDYLRMFLKLDSSRIQIIPRGCRIPTAKEPTIYSKKLITIARINEEQKQFGEMIKVIERLPEGYTLSIYGEGSDAEVQDLKYKIANSTAKEKIHYLGGITDVASALRNHSLFIMTSSFEGFGQTLIEARSQGLPIVIYDTFTAASWVVKDRVTGHLHSFGDSDAMVQSIETILQDESKFKEMSINCLEAAKETDNDFVNELWSQL